MKECKFAQQMKGFVLPTIRDVIRYYYHFIDDKRKSVF